jgi:hypothetical protein
MVFGNQSNCIPCIFVKNGVVVHRLLFSGGISTISKVLQIIPGIFRLVFEYHMIKCLVEYERRNCLGLLSNTY